MTRQHYRLTLSDAIALHQEGLISSTALLYCYLRIRLAPGWKMTLHQREISQQLGISKAQFYRAVSKLKDEGLIDWEAPNGFVVTVGLSSDERNSVSVSETELRQSQLSFDERNSVTPSATPVTPSATNTPAKPAPVKASSVPPDSYQIFIKSLSDSARENFLHFVEEKVASFPNPIQDIQGWLAGKNQAGQPRFRVYYELFAQAVGEGVVPSQDWESHPKWESALAAMEKGVPRFLVLGQPGCEDIGKETRQAMFDYARAKEIIWGKKA
jgi:hypothetical protein